MLEMFTFSAEHGYRITKGAVGELVRDVVLSGNVFATLDRIDGFGTDLKMIESGGGCGKGGQSPLPVTFGSPHLRIADVVVGGGA
jgi:TldD protein